jgi:hypothetical protein
LLIGTSDGDTSRKPLRKSGPKHATHWFDTSAKIGTSPQSATPTLKHGGNGWQLVATIERGSHAKPSQLQRPKRTDLGDNTVRRRTGIAKQFFGYAIKADLLKKNPFNGLAQSVHGNEARQFFVTHELFNSIIDVAPNAEWEAVIALSRLGGRVVPQKHCASNGKTSTLQAVGFAFMRAKPSITKMAGFAIVRSSQSCGRFLSLLLSWQNYAERFQPILLLLGCVVANPTYEPVS